jgi:hypothetical protein
MSYHPVIFMPSLRVMERCSRSRVAEETQLAASSLAANLAHYAEQCEVSSQGIFLSQFRNWSMLGSRRA